MGSCFRKWALSQNLQHNLPPKIWQGILQQAQTGLSTSLILFQAHKVGKGLCDSETPQVLPDCYIISAPVEKDMLTAEAREKQAKEAFITGRHDIEEQFFDSVKKLKLRTFKSTTKTVKLKIAQNKIITYKQDSSVALQLLVISQAHGRISVEELMKYSLSTVAYSLSTADDYMARTDKSREMHFLVKGVTDVPIPDDANTMWIQDDNALFHAMADIPNHFQLISHQIFDNMPRRISFVFSTDMYQEGSIKDMERE